MSDHTLEPGAEYLVTAELGDMPAGARVVFWRHAYSFYDGTDSYFFATPEAYYEGRPGADGRTEPGHLFTYERFLNDRDHSWRLHLERAAPPRPGPAWLPEWWERAIAKAKQPRAE